MQAVIIFVLILAVLLVIFTLQNSVEISISVFFWKISDAPLVLVLICCIVIGYIIAAIYFYPRIWKLKKEYKQMIKFNHELKELHDLNHPKSEEETNPEGIELDDDEEKEDSFFKD
ncbi:MAG TPA: LapA family protein [Draconibacterium sp.]|nr:LapA family protein [Draconibacterium sp.]